MSQREQRHLVRRRLCIFACLFFFFASTGLLAPKSFAADQSGIRIECAALPSVMEPGTILIFDTTSTATMIQGGFPAEDSTRTVEPTQERTPRRNYIQEPPPTIYSGMKVVYNEYSGLIDNILFPDSNEPSGYSIHNFPEPGTVEERSPSASTKPIVTWKWGKHDNRLTWDTDAWTFEGAGRAACFQDERGSRDNPLGPYDLATKQAYSSSKMGDKVVTVRNMDTGDTYIYHQADVRGLPDSVIDIWGLENMHELAGDHAATSTEKVSYTHS